MLEDFDILKQSTALEHCYIQRIPDPESSVTLKEFLSKSLGFLT